MMQEEFEEELKLFSVFVEKQVALQGAERLCEDSGVKNVDAATGVGLNEDLRSSRRKIVTAKRPLRKSGCAGSTAGRSRISNCFLPASKLPSHTTNGCERRSGEIRRARVDSKIA